MRSADIKKDDAVIEIGPGLGTLTRALAQEAESVTAVEIDKSLLPILNDLLSDCKNVKIINADILKMELETLMPIGKRVKIVANLPYYISTPIVMKLLENAQSIASITIMLQKEVADRMSAGRGIKDYGSLSLAVQYCCSVYLAANVPRNCFMPRPNVDSAVVTLTPHDKPPVSPKNKELMFKLIRAAFLQRRKTFVNCMLNSELLSFDRQKITDSLKKAGFDERIRGERLGLEDFARLSDILSEG